MRVRRIGESALTIALCAAIAGMSFVIVRRELAKPEVARSEDLTPPEFLAGWKSLIDSGSTFGRRDAAIQIIEFGDLQCPACKDAQDVLNRTRRKFGERVALTFIHFPLSYHPHALAAARAAECSRRAGRMEQFIDEAYRRQRSFGKTRWTTFASDAGVSDLDGFASCVADTAHVDAIARGLAAGNSADVSGTPTVVVNGWKFRHSPRNEVLDHFIEALLAGEYADTVVPPSPVSPRVTGSALNVATFDTLDLLRAPQFGLASLKTILRDSSAEGAVFDLTHAESAVVLEDGSVVVHSPIGARLYVFDKNGSPKRSLLRLGSGPGEVGNSENAIALNGDTMIVADFVNRRINFYSANKGHIGALKLRELSNPRAGYLIGKLGENGFYFHDGRLLPSRYVEGRTILQSNVMRVDKAGIGRTIAQVPGMTVEAIETRFDGKVGRMALPLRLGPQALLGAWGEKLITGNGIAYAIDIRDASGAITSRISMNAKARQVDDAIRAADSELRLQDLQKQGGKAAESIRLRKAWPVADSVALFSGFFITPRRTLWVLDTPIPGEGEWHATSYNERMQLTGRLVHRGPGTPIAFGDDCVVVKTEDSDGVVSLAIMKLVPRLVGQPLK